MIRNLICERDNIIKNASNDELEHRINKDSIIWVDIESPDERDIKILSDIFKFHPLAVEDCIHRAQRSKVDNYNDYYFIVLNAFKGRNIRTHFTYLDVYVFIGKNYIVTIKWSKLNVIDEVYERIQKSLHMFKRGADFILYNILDSMVDEYYPLTDKIEDKIDEIEEKILSNPASELQNEILTIKRNMIKMRKIISPQRDVLNMLLRHDFIWIKEENRFYYMDVYDHLIRIYDIIDTYQDMLSGTLDLYMSQISNKMNSVMKVLTIITTIMMPLTLITGIYGMNFKYMPELDTRYGYFGALLAMLFIVAAEIIFFKKKKWL